jgi:PAS domain S-box-containing protein
VTVAADAVVPPAGDQPAAGHLEVVAPPERRDGAHLEAIHRLMAAMVAATTVDCIYQAALNVLLSSLPVDRAAILLFDPDGVIRFKAWRGLSESYRQAAQGHTPWRPGDLNPTPVVMADVAHETTLGPLRETIENEGIRSLAFIPLLYGNRLLGKFMLYADRPHDFGADELALAATVAGHIAFALEKRRLEDELRLSADQLAATLNAVGEGITVQAPDGSLILGNQAAAEVLGFPSTEALLGAPPAVITDRFELFDADGQPLDISRLPGRAALRGEEPPEMLVRSRLVASGTERYSLVKARPVRDEDGRVRFAVNVFRDVTDRQRTMAALRTSEARLAFLASASRRLLTTSLEPHRVLEEVEGLVVPELADWCAVREFADDGRLQRVAGGRPREARSELVTRLEGYGDPLNDHPALGEVAAGRSLLIDDITPAMLAYAAADDEHLRLLQELGLRSAMLVPLRSRGRTLGVLTLATGNNRRPYTEADLALAEEFASRVAATVDNARAFANEHATAATLARALLPGRLPDIPGLELAARYRAAGEVGGDFYDCFPTGEGSWLLVVGDVCGRGIHAASMTGLTRHTIRAAALHATSPAAVLADLNRLLVDAADENMAAWASTGDGAEPSFCTVCLAAVTTNATGAQVVVSAAGHPLPMVLRRDGEVTEIGRAGSLLGVMADIDVYEETCQIGPGDALVLFTDGITERRHQKVLFGEEQLDATLRSVIGASAAEVTQRIEDAAMGFSGLAPDDDMAVIAISIPRA